MMKKFYLLLLACLSIILASCNGTTNSTQPDKLVVKRVDPLHQSESGFEKNIDDKKKVLEVYTKLINLPHFPQGIVHCPADNGVQYELTFMHGAKPVSTVMVSALGCQGVTINNKSYWAMEPKGNGGILMYRLMSQNIFLFRHT